MSLTGFAASPTEFDDEERHIVAPPACSEHALHHYHHQRYLESRHGNRRQVLDGADDTSIASVDRAIDTEDEKGESAIVITAVQKMLSACTGSLLTSLLVTPLDVVRVRLQSQPSNMSNIPLEPINIPETSLRAHKLVPPQFQSTWARLPTETGVTTCCREVFWNPNYAQFCIASSPTNPTSAAIADAVDSRRRFTGTWEGLVKIARYEGASSLWRGLSPTLLMAIPANVIYFTGYDSLRTSPISPFSGLNSTWAPLLAGSSARAIAATAISPLELFRTRLWAISTPRTPGGLGSDGKSGSVREVGAFRKTIQGIADMVKVEGWTSLWRGLTLTLWRDVPFSGIYWFGYETIRTHLEAQHLRRSQRLFPSPQSPPPSTATHEKAFSNSANTFSDAFIAGALSGSIAAFLTTPFDVGKTRIQVVQHATPSPAKEVGMNTVRASDGSHIQRIYKSMPSLLHGIWKEEGLNGLWRGCVPRMLKVAPACAIMISSYEVGKQWAEKINESRRR